MCRNVKGDYYYLPGGHVEFGEPADIALAREFMEEAGVHTQVGELMLVTEHSFVRERANKKDKAYHELNLVFHVEHLELPEEEDASPKSQPESESGGVQLSAESSGPATPPPLVDCPEIVSLEDEIAFDWVDLAAVVDLDVRPAEIKAWLASGGETHAGEEQGPISWVSNCDPRTLPVDLGEE